MHNLNLFSYTPRIVRQSLPFAAVLLLFACGGSEQTYAGTLQPQSGTCDTLNRATLQRHGANVQFSPQDGVITLDGTLAPSGALTAAQQTIGMDRKPYRLAFNGQLAGGAVTGTYVTPRCSYAVALKLAE